LTFSGVKQLRFRVNILPAEENAFSALADVAGIAKYSFAIFASVGYLLTLVFHHSRGDSL